MSSSAVNFALTIFLTLQYNSPQVLAYGFIAGLLPMAILGPFAGVFIDRWNKKTTMILADAFVAVCTLLMAVAFMLGFDHLIFIYVMMTFRSIGSAFHLPALQASTSLLAPQSAYIKIAGIHQTIQSLSSIL